MEGVPAKNQLRVGLVLLYLVCLKTDPVFTERSLNARRAHSVVLLNLFGIQITGMSIIGQKAAWCDVDIAA